MHQHPRSPAVPSPAPKLPPKSTPAREDLKDDSTPSSPTTDIRTNTTKGLGIDAGAESSEQAKEAAPGKEAMAKLNQIISVWTSGSPHVRRFGTDGFGLLRALQNYHTKAALIILHSRVELRPSFNKGSDSPRVNRWVCDNFHRCAGVNIGC